MSDGNTCLFCPRVAVRFGLRESEVCLVCAQELAAHVLDACVTSWIPLEKKTPKELLSALMLWEQQIALDPAVSEIAAEWKRRVDLGDAAMALRDQEVALSGRLRERAEAAEQETWVLREAASELLAALVVNATPKLGGPVDLAAVKLNELVKS